MCYKDALNNVNKKILSVLLPCFTGTASSSLLYFKIWSPIKGFLPNVIRNIYVFCIICYVLNLISVLKRKKLRFRRWNYRVIKDKGDQRVLTENTIFAKYVHAINGWINGKFYIKFFPTKAICVIIKIFCLFLHFSLLNRLEVFKMAILTKATTPLLKNSDSLSGFSRMA